MIGSEAYLQALADLGKLCPEVVSHHGADVAIILTRLSLAEFERGRAPSTSSGEDRALVKFASEVVSWASEGHDPDGGEIQDLAVACGLLLKVPYDPEVHSLPDWMEGEVEPGEDYFEYAPTFAAAIRKLSEKPE